MNGTVIGAVLLIGAMIAPLSFARHCPLPGRTFP
jgi:hypothetical protein